ncbi:unnamed protein product [Ceutorhynchus assimilis]|uniref:Parvovirus non-structural protein 1 helicase domain-containing protein n=1 Tax=Ceutorhynchus assimilis TaxID=467358 RepID=A0A9N9Q8E9_9CUCU|nr:unnamed protein product [Ceutorhynchus assimilis]
MGEELFTVKSPGECGFNLVKLEIYPFADVVNLDKAQWWMKATIRSSILTSSPVDPLQMQVDKKTTMEIKLLFANALYNAPNSNISVYYYNLEESINIMNAMLLYQFDNNLEAIRQFLNDLLNVCDRKLPKTNSFFLLSEPNAGKNFFMEAVCSYYISVGVISNFNRYNSFPTMECRNKRILFWDELTAGPSVFEALKALFAGTTLNVKVKYEDDQPIFRTPVIITSNNDIFRKDSAFRTRMKRYRWKACDDLKHLTKFPYPMAWAGLLEKYHCFDGILYQELQEFIDVL